VSPIDVVPSAVFLALVGLTIWFWARIATKAGYSAAWGLLAAVPLLNMVMLCVFALVRWPALPEKPSLTSPAA